MLVQIGSMGYGGEHLNTVLPKALIELQGLFLSGPLAGTTADTAIAVVDGIDVQDTIVKVLGQTGAGVWSDLTADTTINSLNAQGTITIDGGVAGDIITVDGINYTLSAIELSPTSALPPRTVPVGATDILTAAALAQSINAADGNVWATASTTEAVVTIQARAEGVAGNAITLSVASSNGHATASGATLAGGSATNSISISTVTTGSTVFMLWFKKDRDLLQP